MVPHWLADWGNSRSWGHYTAHPKDVAEGSWSCHKKDVEDRPNTVDECHSREVYENEIMKVHSWKERVGERERERESKPKGVQAPRCCMLWGLDFYFLSAVVNRG